MGFPIVSLALSGAIVCTLALGAELPGDSRVASFVHSRGKKQVRNWNRNGSQERLTSKRN